MTSESRYAADGVWPSIVSTDAPALIGFVVDVLGFERQIVVPGEDPSVVVHSQLRWPEGGIVSISTAGREDSLFSQRPVGAVSIYVVTADPTAVLARCESAGAEIVLPLISPEHDPDGLTFGVRDPDGNLWSFGTYRGHS